MSSPVKIFLVFAFLMLRFTPASAMQDGSDMMEWFEGFFQEKKRKPVEETLKENKVAENKAMRDNDPVGETRALKTQGLIHLTRTHDYAQAMTFFIRSLSIEDSLNLKDGRIFTYVAIAHVYEVVGDYHKSAESLSHALEFNRQHNNDITIEVWILNKLGRINAALNKIEEASKNYDSILDKANVISEHIHAEALFNKGHLYSQQGNYKEALAIHKKALDLRREIRDKKNEALSLNDIGELYRLMKNDEKAMANHVLALGLRQGLKDKKGIAESYNNIGVIYYQQKSFERAIANLNLALEAGQESQAQYQIRKSYDYLNLCYEQLGDYKKALENKNRFVAIQDLIQNEKHEQQLLDTENRYVISKKESQIDKLESDRAQREKEIQIQKKLSNFLFAVIGLGAIVIGLVFYLYILKQRSNKSLQVAHDKVNQQNIALQDLNATKDKFFSIISHDLKGPLNSLTSFSSLLINYTDSLSKEEIKMLAQDLDKSLKNLFALLENLLEWSRSQTGNIEFKPEVFDLSSVLEENKELLKAQAQNKKIGIIRADQHVLSVRAHKNSVNTVVRNLISNAIKFTPSGGTVTLGLHQKKDTVIVSVADTGVGMPPEVIQKLFRIDTKYSTKGTADEKGTGLGLILCREFIEKNGGRIWAESELEKGSTFYFTLPYAQTFTVQRTSVLA